MITVEGDAALIHILKAKLLVHAGRAKARTPRVYTRPATPLPTGDH